MCARRPAGPLEATIDDFWRMAWEHCCELMIMLTNLEEVGRTKCAKYWPEEGETTYGAITVSLAEERPYSGTLPLVGTALCSLDHALRVRCRWWIVIFVFYLITAREAFGGGGAVRHPSLTVHGQRWGVFLLTEILIYLLTCCVLTHVLSRVPVRIVTCVQTLCNVYPLWYISDPCADLSVLTCDLCVPVCDLS